MSYEQLTQLLDVDQFRQLQTVREHLLQDPTALDRSAREEAEDGAQEAK